MEARWTHLALHLRNLGVSLKFYEQYANLRVVDRHSDASSTGMDVAWLSDHVSDDRVSNDELSFVMVLQEGMSRHLPDAKPEQPLPKNGLAASSQERATEPRSVDCGAPQVTN